MVVARNLVLTHAGGIVLDLCDLTLPAGATTAVLGPNTRAKSMLLRAIAGHLRPWVGTLVVLGRRPAQTRRRVRYVPQARSASGDLPLTVREVVADEGPDGLGHLGHRRRAHGSTVDGVLERLGLAHLAHRPVGQLTRSRRQLVLIAHGLVHAGELLLLDEPLGPLDLGSQQVVTGVLGEEQRAGRPVVVTTNDLGVAAQAQHVVLVAGRVVVEGPPTDVLVPASLDGIYGIRSALDVRSSFWTSQRRRGGWG